MILIVVIHRGCFKDVRVVRSLLLALQTKTQIVLVHESDVESRGCDFGEVIANCPPAVKAVRGHNDQKIFDPIAVQWTRGAHQAVSVRILAQYLGAHVACAASACGDLVFCLPRAQDALKGSQGGKQSKRAKQAEIEFAVSLPGRGAGAASENAGGAGAGTANPNPMVMNPMVGKVKAGSPAGDARKQARPERDV